MIDRPTPETDAVLARLVKNQAVNSCDAVVMHHARKLEQERDEARTTIEDAKRALNAIGYEGLLLAALRVKEEQDEAREALKHITEYGTEEINAAVELRQKLAQALIERDEWSAMCGRYKQERDTAEKYAIKYQTRIFELIEEGDKTKKEETK